MTLNFPSPWPTHIHNWFQSCRGTGKENNRATIKMEQYSSKLEEEATIPNAISQACYCPANTLKWSRNFILYFSFWRECGSCLEPTKSYGRALVPTPELQSSKDLLDCHPWLHHPFGCSRCSAPQSCASGHFQTAWKGLTLTLACMVLSDSVTGYTFICWICKAQLDTFSENTRWLTVHMHMARTGTFAIQHPNRVTTQNRKSWVQCPVFSEH